MKHDHFSILITIFLCLLMGSCQNDPTIEEEVEPQVIVRDLEGTVQKGPYVPGTGITISVLDSSLNQTGKVYFTEIIDDNGTFKTEQIAFESNFIEIRADGYYSNEIKGKTSESQLTLYALADVSDANSVNVNLLTHLERPRLKYLMKNEGMRFADAKIHAQREVFALINTEPTGAHNSEEINLLQGGTDNSVLLAMSMIFQSNRTVGELTELLTGIAQDIEEDGINDIYYGQLYEGSQTFSIDKARHYFSWSGLCMDTYGIEELPDSLIPDFEMHIRKFRNPLNIELEVVGTSNALSRDGRLKVSCNEGNAMYEVSLSVTNSEYPEEAGSFSESFTFFDMPKGIYACHFYDENIKMLYQRTTYIEIPIKGEMSIIYQRFMPFIGGGWIDVEIRGGTPPYSYFWSSSHAGGTNSSKNLTDIVEYGLYNLTVTDATGKQKSWDIHLLETD